MQSENVLLNGVLIKEKALFFAKGLGIGNFHASDADLSTHTVSPCDTRFYQPSHGLTVPSRFHTVFENFQFFLKTITILVPFMLGGVKLPPIQSIITLKIAKFPSVFMFQLSFAMGQGKRLRGCYRNYNKYQKRKQRNARK